MKILKIFSTVFLIIFILLNTHKYGFNFMTISLWVSGTATIFFIFMEKKKYKL